MGRQQLIVERYGALLSISFEKSCRGPFMTTLKIYWTHNKWEMLHLEDTPKTVHKLRLTLCKTTELERRISSNIYMKNHNELNDWIKELFKEIFIKEINKIFKGLLKNCSYNYIVPQHFHPCLSSRTSLETNWHVNEVKFKFRKFETSSSPHTYFQKYPQMHKFLENFCTSFVVNDSSRQILILKA